jgi:protein-tyrosine phosphatase
MGLLGRRSHGSVRRGFAQQLARSSVTWANVHASAEASGGSCTINHRDVGECLAILADGEPLIAPGRLFRGGKFDELHDPSDLGHPATILNLRRGPDPRHLSARIVHMPADDSYENYQTAQPEVLAWVRRALGVLADPRTAYPVYVHCTSGKDRTGVVVAAALAALGAPDDLIIAEYELSDGVKRGAIVTALAGLRARALLSGGPIAALAAHLR